MINMYRNFTENKHNFLFPLLLKKKSETEEKINVLQHFNSDFIYIFLQYPQK